MTESGKVNPYVYRLIEGFQFRFCEVNKGFNPKGCFSKVTLQFQHVVSDESTPYVELKDIVKFDAQLMGDPDERHPDMKEPYEHLARVLLKCRATPWIPPEKANEKEVLKSLAKTVLLPLFGEAVIFEKHTYKEMFHDVPGASAADIGLGLRDGWYGNPDCRVHTLNFVPTALPVGGGHGSSTDSDPEDDTKGHGSDTHSDPEDDTKGHGSDTHSDPEDDTNLPKAIVCSHTYFKGKYAIDFRVHISQLVATAVVASFTLFNQEVGNGDPNPNPAVPTIWINKFQFRIYDCEHDILLSEPKSLATNGRLSRTGMLLLWLMVYHR